MPPYCKVVFLESYIRLTQVRFVFPTVVRHELFYPIQKSFWNPIKCYIPHFDLLVLAINYVKNIFQSKLNFPNLFLSRFFLNKNI